ncbi:PAS domain S-box protein [bacterium]|nr:PAS domain S-box protein [bacterium]
MEKMFFSLVSPPPPGFEQRLPSRYELLECQLALFADNVEGVFALLDDFTERVSGLVITVDEAFIHRSIGQQLWHLTVPDTVLPYLHGIAACFLDIMTGQNVSLTNSEELYSRMKDLETKLARQQHTESALQVSKARFRDVLENSHDMAYKLNLITGTYEYLSPTSEKLMGFTPDEIIGMGFKEVEKRFHPEDRERYNNHFNKVLNKSFLDAKDIVNTIEYRWKRGDGEYRWYSDNRNLIYENSDSPVAIVGSVRDITDLKQVEEHLHHLRNFLSNIINSMPSMLIGVDIDGHVTQWNREAELSTGLSFNEVVGQQLGLAIPRLANEMGRIREAISSRVEQTDSKRMWLKDGETYYEDVTVYPLVANGVEGAVIRVDDATERVRMEEMMIQSEKMLSVGGLAAGMAHEINNPLAGMIQTAEVLKNRLLGELSANDRTAENVGTTMEVIRQFMIARDVPNMLTTIHESGLRTSKIVDDMLSFSRKSDSLLTSCHISEIIDKAVELASKDYSLKKKYDFRQIEVVREFEARLPKVSCEESKIQQVILNLLRNGAEAMQKEKLDGRRPCFVLRLTHEIDEDMICIEVEDNGEGMDDATRKRIFEPFFTTKQAGVGTGLGLSVSYFIITDNHDGEMSVDSVPGQGSIFKIRIPVKPLKKH